jgi:hypothetical protein
LQPEQNNKLSRSYLYEPGFAVSRPRGKSPQQCTFFTRSSRLKEESSFLASVCSLLGVLPQAGTTINQKALANVTRGELLCQAFEVYQHLMPHTASASSTRCSWSRPWCAGMSSRSATAAAAGP